MKLLIPVTYFNKNSHSEIWQIDTIKQTKKLLTTLPKSSIPVMAKGITGLSWMDKNTLIACDFNRVLKINRSDWKILAIKTDDEFNDLHQLSVHQDKILLSNSGRDSVDVLDTNFKKIHRHSKISEQDWQDRKLGNYKVNDSYYDAPKIKKHFCQRKVPDTYHFNHILQINEFKNMLIVNCFYEKCLRDLKTFKIISNNLPESIHDGFVYQNCLWITTVAGEVYKSPLILPFKFKPVIDLFVTATHHGWARGLFVKDNYAYIGITKLYQKNDRTNWLKQDKKDTRSGIYQFNMNTNSIEFFYNFSHPDGAKIFSIIAD